MKLTVLFSITGLARLLLVILIAFFALKFINRLMDFYKEMNKQKNSNSGVKSSSGNTISKADPKSGEYIDYEEVKD